MLLHETSSHGRGMLLLRSASCFVPRGTGDIAQTGRPSKQLTLAVPSVDVLDVMDGCAGWQVTENWKSEAGFGSRGFITFSYYSGR